MHSLSDMFKHAECINAELEYSFQIDSHWDLHSASLVFSIQLFSACCQSSSARCSALCSSLISCAVAGCATVAEVRKRGDDFWGEFEFYLSDLVVGCVLDCVLVGLLAPAAIIGAKPKTKPTGHTPISCHYIRCTEQTICCFMVSCRWVAAKEFYTHVGMQICSAGSSFPK